MKDTTWLEAFAHELEAAGIEAPRRAEVLVETESFIVDAGVDAFGHFGPPSACAVEIASALGGEQRRSKPLGPPVLEVEALAKSYRRRPVVSGISLQLRPGEVAVLTGSNGAGKSTVLRVIAGIESADEGEVRCSGRIGYVPQAGGLDPYLRPVEHFALFGAAAGGDRSASVQEGCRLARELGWDAAAAPIVRDLSGGTAQKLQVIAALLGAPDVLLLDEPYQGMDADSAQRFWELLWAWSDNGGSAVVSSHSSDALARATTVIEIEGLATT